MKKLFIKTIPQKKLMGKGKKKSSKTGKDFKKLRFFSV